VKPLIVERPRRAQVDGRAQRAFFGVGLGGLAHRDELKRSEAKTLKSNERPRLVPPPASEPPAVVRASMPLMRTRVNCGPRPRTEIWRPSPPSRARATPGMRWMDSERFRSGNLPMSSARMESTAPPTPALDVQRLVQAGAEAGDDHFGHRVLSAAAGAGASCRRRRCPPGPNRRRPCRALASQSWRSLVRIIFPPLRDFRLRPCSVLFSGPWPAPSGARSGRLHPSKTRVGRAPPMPFWNAVMPVRHHAGAGPMQPRLRSARGCARASSA
jgi:hypothetical protein